MSKRSVAIVCGGTAGHVYPALAVADAYRDSVHDIDIHLIGTPSGYETRVVDRYAYHLNLIGGSPVLRVGALRKVAGLVSIGRGVYQARRLLKEKGVDLVIGLGGYASAGVLVAARSLGIPSAIHESNAKPGLTNELLGSLVDRIYLGFNAAAQWFPETRTRIVGNPTRPDIAELASIPRIAPFGTDRPVRLLVTGGSNSSEFFNEQVPSMLWRVTQQGLSLDILHQVGQNDPVPTRTMYERLGVQASVVPHIEDMVDAHKWADFAITRAGSGTLGELAASGLPALIVPLSNAARDHQTANAREFTAGGGGWWVSEAEWETKKVAGRIARFLADEDAWRKASESARLLASPNAALAMVADCEALMAGV